MAKRPHGVRRPSADTDPHDICPVCRNAIVLRGGDEEACGDPECEAAHGYVPPTRFVVDAETAARIEDRLANPRKPNDALRALWSGCPFCNEPTDRPHKVGCRHPEDR